METKRQEDCLYYLYRGLLILYKVHRKNNALCTQLKEWNNRDYGWHIPYFPPEYKICCLKGTDFEPDQSCDLYMFFIKFFIWVTGEWLPVNFQMNGSWQDIFREHTEKWDIDVQDAVMDLFSLCTNCDKDRRIQNAIELSEQNSLVIIVNCNRSVRLDEKETIEDWNFDSTKEWKWRDIFLFD